MNKPALDEIDRKIINSLQGGFPLSSRPYADAAAELDLDEQDLLARLKRMLDVGVLSRFGPMYNAEELGGAVTLCALEVPDERFDAVTELVNNHREVAHNYARDHRLNMWFVIATEGPVQIAGVIAEIERETGLKVYDFPKSCEFFVGLKVAA